MKSSSRKPRLTEHRGSSNSLRAVSPSNNTLADIGDDVYVLKERIRNLEDELNTSQASYISRERAYKAKIDELEEEINDERHGKSGWMKTDGRMKKLKNMQKQIIDNVELVQDRTSKILQEQERDLLRAFRARLVDVQTELEKEKSKKDDGAGAWIEKSHMLESDVDKVKEIADRFERC